MSKETQTVYTGVEWEAKKEERTISNFYVNVPFRFLAGKVVNLIYSYPITPNMVSIMGIFMAGIGGIILILSNENNAWRAIPFFLSIGLFGAVDGRLARKKEIFSPFGSWINMFATRLEFMIIGLSFSWYAYSVTHDYIIMFCCMLTYVFREGIGTISILTIGKVPAYWKNIYSKKFLYQKNKLIEFFVKSFFYSGNMYVILVCIGIIFPSNLLLILFMVIYGVLCYIVLLFIVGKKVYLDSISKSNIFNHKT